MGNVILFGQGGGTPAASTPPTPSTPYAQELSYIESNGTQYIDTGFVPNQDTRVVARCVLPLASSTQALFGCRVSSSSNQYQFVTQGGNYRTDYNTTIANVSTSDYGQNEFYVDKNKNVTDLNGDASYTHSYGTFTCPGNMYVFATNNNGALYAYATAKLYSMKIYDNGTLVRDYIPVLDHSGVACLFDKVAQQLVYNAGTGVFAYE